MIATLRSAANRLPEINRFIAERDKLRDALVNVAAERDALRAEIAESGQETSSHNSAVPAVSAELAGLREACGFVPPGHYYSPLPALSEIRRDEAPIFGSIPRMIPGEDLREGEQLTLLQQFAKLYPDIRFGNRPKSGAIHTP